jgi:hypothetical protein
MAADKRRAPVRVKLQRINANLSRGIASANFLMIASLISLSPTVIC